MVTDREPQQHETAANAVHAAQTTAVQAAQQPATSVAQASAPPAASQVVRFVNRPQLGQFVDQLEGLLGQGWFYHGSSPGRDQSECRVTECFDLLSLLAELIGDIQRMADACDAIIKEAQDLGLSEDTINTLSGMDLGQFARAHERLAKELAEAANRTVDLIGDAKHD